MEKIIKLLLILTLTIILFFQFGGFLNAEINFPPKELEQVIAELDSRILELLALLKDDKMVTPSILKEVLSIESMLYEEMERVTEKVKKVQEATEKKDFHKKLFASYLLLSTHYANLLDRIVELGKKVKLEQFKHPSYIAVMIENSSRSRPQSGHSLADVFYEIPVEGGITRYMLIFNQDKFKNNYLLGPVRSARDYFLFLAQEYGALYIHCGGSPQAYAYMDKYKFRHIDEIHTPGAPFFRSKDRHPPHNLYVYSNKLYKWIFEKRKPYLYGKKTFPFKISSQSIHEMETQSVNARNLYLDFYRYYHVKYVYNKNADCYQRYINGKPDIDQFTGKQNIAKNVIVQFVRMKVIDKEGRLKIDFLGSGEGLLLQEGRLLKIKWRKEKLFSPTRFFVNGKEINFIPGKIDIIFFPLNKRTFKKVRWN